MGTTATLLLLGAIVLFIPFHGNSQTRNITKFAGSLSLFPFNTSTKEFYSMSVLPPDIQEKVIRHLTNRVGADFYGSLKLDRVIIVDFDELKRVKPDWKSEIQWKVPKYELGFSFVRRDKGIKYYEATIRFDENGAVLREIDLPPMRLHPEKAEMIPVQTAIKIGKANQFSTEWVRIAYREEDESIVWQLLREDKDGTTWRMDVSAHTGKILNTVGWIGIR